MTGRKTEPGPATLLYPHQLFPPDAHPALAPGRPVVMIEEPLFFTHLRFHKQKLVLHRASMKAYEASLRDLGYSVRYVEARNPETRESLSTEGALDEAAGAGVKELHVVEPDDYLLSKRIRRWAAWKGVKVVTHASPLFLTPPSVLTQEFGDGERFRMADFYRRQRRRMDVLMEGNEPAGGRWSFDAENREPLPKRFIPPEPPEPSGSPWVAEAKDYVGANFHDHYGSAEGFFFPVTRDEALAWFDRFLAERLDRFGPYEDAFTGRSHSFLYHSVLTPFLNIGLATPAEVLGKLLGFSAEHGVPINSVEGYVRQLIGWREFMHGLYVHHGTRVRGENFFRNRLDLPESFWEGTTGFDPIDAVITKVRETAYAHHIERLMVMSNFFVLAEIDPHHAYGWFMELFIDAYDWVMVPNVYSMGLFADGGVMATKPYVSSSNYLASMSDWKRVRNDESHWSGRWDSLYWRFLAKHRAFFDSNPRLSRLTGHLDRMTGAELGRHERSAGATLREISDSAPRFDRAGERALTASS